MMATAKTIGMMNGRWAWLFKVALICIPLLIALECWQTRSIFLLQGDVKEIVHLHDAIAANTEAIRANSEAIRTLPPQDWRERIKQLEADMRQNNTDHTEIKLLLSEIRAAVKPRQE